MSINICTSLKITTFPQRDSSDDCFLIFICCRMSIDYFIYHMHRCHNLYDEDAALFQSERWEDEKFVNIKWGYLPFNSELQMCFESECSSDVKSSFRQWADSLLISLLLENFSIMKATYSIIYIIQTFSNMKLSSELEQEEIDMKKQTLTLIISIVNGCKVQLYWA